MRERENQRQRTEPSALVLAVHWIIRMLPLAALRCMRSTFRYELAGGVLLSELSTVSF